MTSDLIQVQSDASGDINVELSYGSYDQFIEGALASTFGTITAISAADIDASAVDDSFNSASSDFTDIVDGQWVKVAGYTDPANNGVFKVLTATAAKLIVQSTLVTEAAGPTITVGGEMIRNGVELQSYTIQKHLQDPTTPTFFNFTGARVGTMSLDFQTGQIMTGAFGVMALASTTDTSQIAGASIVPATTSTPLNSVGNLSQIVLDGAVSSSQFNSLSFSLDNALRAQDAIGSLPHVGIALGRLDVSGNISIYFEDSTLYNKYLNATGFALSFVLQDSSSNTYVVTLPNIKFESGTIVAGGLDSDVMFEAGWKAILDPTTDCMVQIDKL
jgi:hypothetical protein